MRPFDAAQGDSSPSTSFCAIL